MNFGMLRGDRRGVRFGKDLYSCRSLSNDMDELVGEGVLETVEDLVDDEADLGEGSMDGEDAGLYK